ncbi:MAG: CHAP domain-containing protein [Oscillospiraceae bacterium]|jgi:hypothetical protein|nr:CHAP domain-containing protein [Oscillospiraceae bacterium]
MTQAEWIVKIAQDEYKDYAAKKTVGGAKYQKASGYNTSVAWCAIFARWCFDQAKLVSALTGWSANCVPWLESEKKAGRTIGLTQGQPGDLIFLDYVPYNQQPNHVGVIVGTSSNGYKTIEGNWENKIVSKDRPWASSEKYRILAIVRPKYKDAAAADGVYPAEQDFVNTSGANLNIWGDTRLTQPVGELFANGQGRCLGILGGRALVRYQINENGKLVNEYKIGFTSYSKGAAGAAALPSPKEKEFVNTSGASLKIWGDTRLTTPVGELFAGGKGKGLGILRGKAIVRYQLNENGKLTNEYKIGFTSYLGGIA